MRGMISTDGRTVHAVQGEVRVMGSVTISDDHDAADMFRQAADTNTRLIFENYGPVRVLYHCEYPNPDGIMVRTYRLEGDKL